MQFIVKISVLWDVTPCSEGTEILEELIVCIISVDKAVLYTMNSTSKRYKLNECCNEIDLRLTLQRGGI